MGLEIHRLGPGRLTVTDRGTSAGLYEVTQHLWRTADGRLVETGDLEAKQLAYTSGQHIPVETAVAEGLLPADALAPAEVPSYPPDASSPAAPEPPPAKKASGRSKKPPAGGAGDG